MNWMSRQFRIGAFVWTLAAFALPFMTVSCPGGSRSVSGFQASIGMDVETPQMFGPSKTEHKSGEPLLLVALLTGVAGVGITLSRRNNERFASGCAGLLGAVLLLLAQNSISTQAQQQGAGILSVHFEIGYWAALLGFVAAAASAFLRAAAKGVAAASSTA